MKTDHLHIIPECYVDTNLVQILMRVKGVNHQHSCGQVTNTMQNRFNDSFSIGIVDNDDRQSKYSQACVEIARSKEIILCKHPDSHHYLVKIINIMETFILHCIDDLGFSVVELGIPGGIEDLKKITKDKDSLDNPELRKILKAVSQAKEMRLLKDILNYLDSSRYISTECELKEIFAKYGY